MRQLLLAALLLATAQAARAQDLTSEDDKALYAIGAILGRQLDVFGLKPNELAIVKRGLEDAVTGKKLAVDPMTMQQQVNALAQKRVAVTADRQKTLGNEYLAKAAKEKGAQTIAGGAVYVPIKEGSGASPKATDAVKADYTGKLIDGTVFDASAKHGGPASFRLDGVITCWKEGLQKMKVGGKAKLVCPAATAYGDRPPPGSGIQPGATLVFDVELVGIEAAQGTGK